MIGKICPKCHQETLETQHTQNNDEILEEIFCCCGYYDSQIISVADIAESIMPEVNLPDITLPDNFSF